MNLPLLQELVEAHGAPGQEENIRAIVKRELGPLTETSVDAMGNMICLRRGSAAKKVMVAAHMDEIGFMVKYIDNDGFIRVTPLGGFDTRQLNSQRVVVHSAKGPIPGLFMYGTKPKHMLAEGEGKGEQQLDQFFVDTGLGSEAKDSVQLGDYVTLSRSMIQLGNSVSCKAMDDRACVFIMIEAVKKAGVCESDIYAVATVQEEIGLRGAAAAGSSIAPDVVVALDVTLSNDIPGISEPDHVTKLGKGAAIKILDSSLICHPKVVQHFKKLAVEHNIPYQIEILARGGTDSGAVQRLHGGIPAFTLSTPTRYIHTVNEMVNLDDLQACIDLLAAFLQDSHQADYSFE